MEWLNSLTGMIEKARQKTCKLNGWILITPELANELLKFNVNNYRSKRPENVEKYAREMKEGNWKKNGEPIVFSYDGVLRNGQHRLTAIAKGKVPVLVNVVFDADPCTIYDTQYKRSLVQILRATGYSVSPLIPAVARAAILGRVSKTRLGDIEVCDYIINHFADLKRVETIVKSRISNKSKMVGSRTGCAVIAYAMLRTKEMTENELVDFFKALNSGNVTVLNGKDVSPALALRNQMLSFEGYDQSISNRFMEYTYLALKDFHNQTAVDHHFIYSDDGKNAERLIRELQFMDGNFPNAA